MTIGEYITKYRDEHGEMSQRAFAALVGLSPQYVANLERGINNHGKPLSPTMETISKIAGGTGLSDVELMSMIKGTVRVNPSEPDDPFYHITMIGRGMEKMTQEKKDQALQLLRVAFPEEFSD